jgi:hypothetical protein
LIRALEFCQLDPTHSAERDRERERERERERGGRVNSARERERW